MAIFVRNRHSIRQPQLIDFLRRFNFRRIPDLNNYGETRPLRAPVAQAFLAGNGAPE